MRAQRMYASKKMDRLSDAVLDQRLAVAKMTYRNLRYMSGFADHMMCTKAKVSVCFLWLIAQRITYLQYERGCNGAEERMLFMVKPAEQRRKPVRWIAEMIDFKHAQGPVCAHFIDEHVQKVLDMVIDSPMPLELKDEPDDEFDDHWMVNGHPDYNTQQ